MPDPVLAADAEPLDFIASCPPPAQTPRAPSIASSSRSQIKDGSKSRRKGKSRAIITDESEEDMDVDPTPGPSRLSTRRKARPRLSSPTMVPSSADPASSPTQTISLRRPRLRLSSPKPPLPPLPTLKLKVPARNKGKEREEDTDESKGMFDEFLAPEDRDVVATSVSGNDKARFEASRVNAEVRLGRSRAGVGSHYICVLYRRSSCHRRRFQVEFPKNQVRRHGRYAPHITPRVHLFRLLPLALLLHPPLLHLLQPLHILHLASVYGRYVLVNGTSIHGMMRLSRKNICLCQTGNYGYANFVSSI